jgi:hypothetical protein
LRFKSKQEDAGRNVTGTFGQQSGYIGNPGAQSFGEVMNVTNGAFSIDTTQRYPYRDATEGGTHTTAYNLHLNASNVWGSTHTANEFRPSNYAITYCIKST